MRKSLAALFGLALLVVSYCPVWGQQATDKWEKDIAAFEAADAKSPRPKNAVLFVGSSSIRLWDLKESFPDLRAINRGFGGSEIADSVRYAKRIVIPHSPRIVVFYAGDNDIAGGKSPEQRFRGFQRVCRARPRGAAAYKDRLHRHQAQHQALGLDRQDSRREHFDP